MRWLRAWIERQIAKQVPEELEPCLDCDRDDRCPGFEHCAYRRAQVAARQRDQGPSSQ